MNFSQTLELVDENGVTAYKILQFKIKLIEDSKRPANYGGPSLYVLVYLLYWFPSSSP